MKKSGGVTQILINLIAYWLHCVLQSVYILNPVSRFVFNSSTSLVLLTHSHPKYLYALLPAGNTIVMTVDLFDMVIMHSLAFGAT